MAIQISAIICTYNRSHYLHKALNSLINQTLSKDDYEILVIDNGSSDDTKKVTEGFFHIQNLRYIYEPILGLSQARNTGWKNAKGKYIAYLDDDAVASPQWLEKIVEAFERVKPMPGCIGGKIEPIWESARPPWLSERALTLLPIIDWAATPIILNNNQWLAGANMAFLAGLLRTAGGFNENLDRKGSRFLYGSDILLEKYIRSKGYHCFYHPEIIVKHHIPSSRLTQGWFLNRSFGQGVSDGLIHIYQESPPIFKRIRKGFSTILRIILSPHELFCFLMPTNKPICFELKCSVAARIGHVLVLWGIVR